MRALKKVWRYVKRYKKLLFITIITMLIVQALGLVAPLIVKNILDEQLLGITNPWYEVNDNTKDSVFYKEHYYSQKNTKENGVSIVTISGKYYFIDDIVVLGNKKIEDGNLVVTSFEGNVIIYNATLLDTQEVLSFYKPFINPLIILIIMLFVRFFLQIVFTYIQRTTTAKINVNIIRDARKDAVRALQKMPMSYLETEPAGKIANRIISDVNGMSNLFSTIMNLLVNASLSVVFAYIGMFYLDAKLALITFIIFPIVYFWLRWFIRRLNTIAIKVNEQNSMITAQLNEIINGINILQIFNYKNQTEEKFNELGLDFMNEKIKENKLHLSLGWNLIRLVGALITAFIILYFGTSNLTISGFVVSAGIIYAYNDYLTRLVEPVGILFREIGNFQHAIVKTERIFKIIDSEQEDSTFTEIPKYIGHIVFDDVWFSYKEGSPVLKGIDIDVKPGQMVGLVGHTGSGKSSLMSLLLRFYDLKPNIDRGHIYIDDIDITTYPKRSYRKHIGIILQDPAIFKGTIADNIRFGENSVTDMETQNILSEIGGQKLLEKMPNGIKENLKRGGGNLSIGEKQLISFARAVVHNPSILIMDEATANIDTETESLIQKALDKVKEGRTTIVIAHRLSTIKNADKIIVLENGIKVEEGKHLELLQNNKVYANIYRSQIKVGEENV
ncbi:MAG: ATP-binding cassette domain-containing protein [Acholeplasmatales bacterium]|jgi:ATP-binding cassette subfamily B protein|nr:ATP-binding cassette domain-containing protein [Acholeplasmatales bacterium]